MEEILLLVADADAAFRKELVSLSTANGWKMDEAGDGVTALKLFRRNEYDLILLNRALPELDGRNVLIQMRKVSDVPIFALAGTPSEPDALDSYALGADDWIEKPLSLTILAARIRVFLHRRCAEKEIPQRRISYRGLHIDTFSHTVYVDERPVVLTPKKYALLTYLFQNPNRAFARSVLLDAVWGPDFSGSDRTVDTHVKSLRHSIRPYDDCIVTVWGYGYKFEA